MNNSVTVQFFSQWCVVTNCCGVILLLYRTLLRNQEKGVSAKGVSVESSVTRKEEKHPRMLGPAVHLALRAPQPREAYILQNPLLKTPFSWFLIYLISECSLLWSRVQWNGCISVSCALVSGNHWLLQSLSAWKALHHQGFGGLLSQNKWYALCYMFLLYGSHELILS